MHKTRDPELFQKQVGSRNEAKRLWQVKISKAESEDWKVADLEPLKAFVYGGRCLRDALLSSRCAD